jgi:colanic acid biosynthesis glycosyl transferase WcaI
MVEKLYEKGVEYDKAKIFINWVDTSVIYPLPKSSPNKFRLSWGVCEDDLVLMYSGNMGEKQGLDLLIDVARLVKDNKKIYFVLCGDGVTFLKLQRTSSDLQNIFWMPLQPIADLNELLNAADIHLLPQISSVSDLVMPSKLTGIFASGRPVIATAIQNTMLHKTVESRGISVVYGDVEAFVNAIFFFQKNPEKLKKFGNAARKYALDNLDVNIVLSSFESELKSTLR